jgi:beta-glucosidase
MIGYNQEMEPTTPYALALARIWEGSNPRTEAAALVAQMTTQERLDCLDGDTDFWPGLFDMAGGGYYEHPWPAAVVSRLGVPGIHFADGPRGCVVGAATAFPVAMARGATWDPDLEEDIGYAIGAELRAQGATFTGAVCVNLLRHPGWGRAQETYGEDPYHVGEMGAAFTRGLQSWVLACVKHFAVNSMENARFRVDVTADERALHEVYLPHFKRIVDEGVASVMSAYNSLNGEWCGQNSVLLTDILRTEWGFEGFVISDFIFGLRDSVASVKAGLDIEMPFRQQRHRDLPGALTDGSLSEADIDERVIDIVATLLRFDCHIDGATPDRYTLGSGEHRRLANLAAQRSIVLLQNTGSFLPVDPARLRRVAVLGRLAAVTNLGDGGSSDVHPPTVATPLDGLRDALPGVHVEHHEHDVQIAAGADLCVVVVGTTKADEGEYIDTAGTAALASALFPEMTDADRVALAANPPKSREDHSMSPGGDRRSLHLRAEDIALIRSCAATNHNTVVAIMGGSAFIIEEWRKEIPAILMLWYPGMEGGHALADVIVGHTDPGGRLPFAIPTEESHLPHFDPDAATETYDLWHGQWTLDRDDNAAAFPFGFGLSYGSFVLGEASGDINSGVGCVIVNDSDRPASTVVQVYASVPGSAWERPVRKLVGFTRVDDLEPGEERSMLIPCSSVPLRIREDGDWIVEGLPVRLEIAQFAGDPNAIEVIEPLHDINGEDLVIEALVIE